MVQTARGGRSSYILTAGGWPLPRAITAEINRFLFFAVIGQQLVLALLCWRASETVCAQFS
jgi:hypothetical protein